MLTVDSRSIRQSGSRQPHAHHCEAFAVFPSEQSQFLEMTWLDRVLVPSTFEALQWLSSLLEAIARDLDGPVQQKARLWLGGSAGRGTVASRLYSGEGFNFEAPDGAGTVYLLSVSPECRSTPPKRYDSSHTPTPRRVTDDFFLRPGLSPVAPDPGRARSRPAGRGGLHVTFDRGLRIVRPRP
ncbi:hypothetical protein ACWD4V_16370 [Streptomyces tsukubensis]|uniref:hypothetical protein n=1 Tax=Streptomyces tsukubensis TaxID=83656 RepID=UPI0036C8C0F8